MSPDLLHKINLLFTDYSNLLSELNPQHQVAHISQHSDYAKGWKSK